jgi:hypothetical protein
LRRMRVSSSGDSVVSRQRIGPCENVASPVKVIVRRSASQVPCIGARKVRSSRSPTLRRPTRPCATPSRAPCSSSMVTLMRPRPPEFGDVFQLHVSLCEIEPAIWRGLCVPADATLGDLHQVLQVAFGWQDRHLHDFEIHDIRFGMADTEDPLFSVDENSAPLGAVAREGSTFLYQYDFGDSWEHQVKVERVVGGGDDSIVCTGGARACPPEDCGASAATRACWRCSRTPRTRSTRT